MIVDTFDENGEKIIFNQIIAFVVGAGGFGGKKDSSHIKPITARPKRTPDATFTDKTIIDQVTHCEIKINLKKKKI